MTKVFILKEINTIKNSDEQEFYVEVFSSEEKALQYMHREILSDFKNDYFVTSKVDYFQMKDWKVDLEDRLGNQINYQIEINVIK